MFNVFFNYDLFSMMHSYFDELFQLIEESEERFDEDQLNKILAIVSETLPPGPETSSNVPSEAEYEENV